MNEAQYEEKFEERYLHYIDNDADDDEMTSNHSWKCNQWELKEVLGLQLKGLPDLMPIINW